MLARFKSLVLRYRLYRLMPPNLAARLLLTKPTTEDIEWARREIEKRGERDRVRIVRAAIRTADGEVFSVPPPGRHHDVIRVMAEVGADTTHRSEQGFLTSSGVFVDRWTAAILAVKAGQTEKPRWGEKLFSEDLW